MRQISFIIPTYNSSLYIARCLDSIYSQYLSMDLFEVIVVDDGSTDNTRNILIEYRNKYSNFMYYTQMNSGPGVARNLAIRQAHGEYIQFVDSDDYIHQYNFERLISICKSYDLDILGVDSYIQAETGETSTYSLTNGYRENKTNILFCGREYMIYNRFIASPCCYVFKRQFLIDYSLFYRKTKGCEDIDHTIITLFMARRIMYVNEIYYVCCVRSSSLSHLPTIAFELSLSQAILYSFHFLDKQNEYHSSINLQRILSDWLVYIFKIQYNHLYMLPLNEAFHILQETRGDIQKIVSYQKCSNKFLKQKMLLIVRAKSTLAIFSYILLQKLYNRVIG